ncbi:hypothetical protein BGZ51_008368 [Haplosporangium sp. Z 767]|nr:hypothetical protein BGZ51_008368 [Haplosporangium sp. Z 767]KAF9195840.1 hypothetical protein BGZ50_003331 [Haplosporangium sp. Z 11]
MATFKPGPSAQESAATLPPSSNTQKVPPKKPVKRIRITTACINCRQKKIKCDGESPCAHCEKYRSECVYPATNKPANQEYVETLENRLKSVESHLQGLLSRGWGKGAGGPITTDGQQADLTPDDVETNFPYTPASNPATPPSKLLHPNSTVQRPAYELPLIQQFSGASISTPALTGGDSEPDDSAFTTDDSMQVLSLLMGSLKVDRDGAAHYIPKTLSQKERSYTDTRLYSSSPTSSFPSFSTPDWESIDLPLSYTLPSTLLTPKAISSLMDIYFNSVHTFLPVIHKASFLTLCQEGEYRVPPFLLMAICAVAARHATDFELQEIPELLNLKSHHALYDHARSLLDTYMDVPRLSTVQGLLLLAYYQTKEKRSGHFFRIRMYVNLATRMALDMGLHRALRKSLKEIEPLHTGDSIMGNVQNRPLNASNWSSHSSSLLNARRSGAQTGMQSRDKDAMDRPSLEKQMVSHQENRLAWLGCFFLDGLTSSLMGHDYCVRNAALDMRKLIGEASQMTDTVQGATLIFWYHHLELVQIYRQVCVFYRAIPNEQALTKAIRGADMMAIESSLEDWLLNLPAHLVYVESQGNGASLPSYYTLYLHRFYYSHKLLLYRPLISNKTHRGELKDSNSPIAKCSKAALMLTQIGEIIFQNYSWPWPGCGLFAYHMLQAAEIHVFQMVTQSAVDSQSLYYRTMDLIKGYVSLAKLPDLEKDVAAMEDMVNNFLMTPQNQGATPPASSSGAATAASSFSQQQHFVTTPASDYSYAGVMSPASPTESVQRMSMNQRHHQSSVEDADMFSPLQTHAYPSFESAGRVFRQPQSASTIAAATATAASPGFMPNAMSGTTGFPVGFDIHNASSAATMPQTQHSSTSAMYDPTNALSFYGSAATPGASINMFNSNQSNSLSYSQPSFLQPTSTPVGDLLSLDSMNSNAVGSSFGAQQSLSMSSSFSNGQIDGAKKKSVVPPPKPLKRTLPQSTGSSSSSGVSQSVKPPVPKKPTRWIAPRPDTSVNPAPVPLIPSSSGSDMYYSGKPVGTGGHPAMSPSSSTHATGPGNSPNGGPNGSAVGNGRSIKLLQPQTTLYGMGTLVNSLGVEQQVHPMPDDNVSSSGSLRGNQYQNYEHSLQYLEMNPHLYDQLPPNRRPLI